MELLVNRNRENLIRSGVYMGGIGAGGFEIRPDGKFYRCRMFNDWEKEPSIDACFIYQDKNETRILRLDELISPAGVIKGTKQIRYQGEFPKVKISYPELPVEIEFVSYFIPGDIKNSSLPSITFKIKGKGRVYFIFPSFYKSKPVREKQKLFMKSAEGEVGVYSPKGEVYYALNSDMIFQQLCRGLKVWPKKNDFRGPGKHIYSIICWEGNIKDEATISWYFPKMKDKEGNLIGHYYANYFKSCREVSSYVVRNRQSLMRKTEKFYKKIGHKKAPQYLKDSYSAQLSNFVKESWLTKDGKFGVWEGSSCCCGLQTTDVSYYGSWLYVKLFPELEKSAIRLTAKFQRKDGWISHSFPGTFKHIDEYKRKDLNMQFVLMVYRDYYLWKDKKFLKEMFPKLKKAIRKVYDWDADGDKIPDIKGPDQTFDVWDWKGCSIYLSTLWLATLRVGMEIGKEMQDNRLVQNCERDFRIVKENILKKLWNGKYFILWRDGKKKDEGCLLDGLTGDWYSYLLGLGHILPEDMVESHLKTCLRYNKKKIEPSYMKRYYTPGEDGKCYINGGYKDNERFCFQQQEPWTGIEYVFAAHLYIMGMEREALKVIKDVYDRKIKCGMVWDHRECGGDYFRPMAIGILWDLLGKRIR